MTDTSTFLALIEKGSEHLATLCRLSDLEKQAIERQSADELQSVVMDKRQALQALAENTDERNQLLQQAGFSCDQNGIATWFDSLPASQSQPLRQAWQQLTDNLQHAAELNRRNEQIVSRNQKNLEQLLSILRGHNTKTTIYDQAGLKNYSARSTLGKA